MTCIKQSTIEHKYASDLEILVYLIIIHGIQY